MSFDQSNLRPINSYDSLNKRGYGLYLYTTNDPIDEVLGTGYFTPNPWIVFQPGDIVQAQTSDGFVVFVVTDDITSVRLMTNVDLITDQAIMVSSFEAQPGMRYRTDTTVSGYTVTVAPNFQPHALFRVKDVNASWSGTNILRVDFGGSGYNYQGLMGASAIFEGNVANDGQTFIYIDESWGFEQW